MERFELRKSTIEISYKDRFEIKEGCTADQDYDVIQKFSTKEEALEELKDYKTEVQQLSNHGKKYFYITEFYVECEGDIWDYSKLEIELVEKPSYETIATFNSYEAAEKAYNEYAGENEVYISLL